MLTAVLARAHSGGLIRALFFIAIGLFVVLMGYNIVATVDASRTADETQTKQSRAQVAILAYVQFQRCRDHEQALIRCLRLPAVKLARERGIDFRHPLEEGNS
jgi:hypothetical protein